MQTSESNKKYYDENREVLKVKAKAYRVANKAKISVYTKAYYDLNSDHIREVKIANREVGKPGYIASIKRSAKKRGIPCELSSSDIKNILEESNMVCALSGLPLSDDVGHPHKASIDRKDSELGYTYDNCQVISKTLNYMKRDLPQSEFYRLCSLVTNNSQV